MADNFTITDRNGNAIIIGSSEDSSSVHRIHKIALDWVHQEVHESDSYHTYITNAALGAASAITIYLKTPNTTKWSHLTVKAQSSVESLLEVLEEPTVTVDTGTTLALYNRNRNSSNTSGALDNASSPTAGQGSQGVTITDDGTVLTSEIYGGNGFIGGEGRDETEWILKQNTAYVFRLTSNAADNEVTLQLDWYEHTF